VNAHLEKGIGRNAFGSEPCGLPRKPQRRAKSYSLGHQERDGLNRGSERNGRIIGDGPSMVCFPAKGL
jgi:hypothetical protein